MIPFAAVIVDPGVIAWVAVGLIPGFLAARVYRGGRYGPVWEWAVALTGVAAAVGAGALVRSAGPAPVDGLGLWRSTLAAAAAATLAVWVAGLVVRAARSPLPTPAALGGPGGGRPTGALGAH